MNRKLQLSFLFFTLLAVPGLAQTNLGVATGSHSRINSMYLNPANIVDTQEKITVTLFSLNIAVDNSLGTFGKLSNLGSSLNNSDSNSQSVFKNSGRSKFSMMLPSVNIHGPGLLVNINKKNSIGITTGIRVMNQFNNFDQTLYNTISNTGSVSNTTNSLVTQKFNWTAHMWNEIGITYGGVFIDKPHEQLKVGVTLRRLGGIGYVSLKGNNLDLHYSAGADSFYASHSDLEFASSIVSDSSAVFSGINGGNLLSRIFGATVGSGVGGDIGVIYSRKFGNLDPIDYMESSITHNLVLSASVTDIGAINYKGPNAMINISGNGYVTGNGLSNNVTDYNSFKTYMKQQGFNIDTSSAGTKLHLPTALILSADYELKDRYYVNATFISNLANRQNYGNSYYNRLSITPRYDTRIFSFAIPISYSWLAHDVKVGFGLRASGFFIGSDDMLAVFSNNQYGFNLNMGGYVPIKYRHKKTLEEHDHWERIVQ